MYGILNILFIILTASSEVALAAQTTFYFDLGSPFAYLSAERIDAALPGRVTWLPLSLGGMFKLNGRSSWALGDPERRQAGMAEVESRALSYGLPPIRWPDPWPGNYLMAMRAATFAEQRGRIREFATCALRSSFRQGNDLGIPERVLEAAREAGLDPLEVAQATQDPQIKLLLRERTEAAHRLGVFGVPTLAVAGELFWGDDRLAGAARLAQAES